MKQTKDIGNDRSKFFDGKMEHETHKDSRFHGFIGIDIGLAEEMLVSWTTSGHTISYAPGHAIENRSKGPYFDLTRYSIRPRRVGVAPIRLPGQLHFSTPV
jgi:hypothetical protein